MGPHFVKMVYSAFMKIPGSGSLLRAHGMDCRTLEV